MISGIADVPRVRRLLWWLMAGGTFLSAALAAGLWTLSGRDWGQLGFRPPEGAWCGPVFGALLVALLLFFFSSVRDLRKSREERAKLHKILDFRFATYMPSTRTELRMAYLLSINAGVCEEFLFRGYLIAVLAPLVTWWGAAAISMVLFVWGHRWKGRRGMLATFLPAVALTALVAATNSLWYAIALHTVLDIGICLMAFEVLSRVQFRLKNSEPA